MRLIWRISLLHGREYHTSDAVDKKEAMYEFAKFITVNQATRIMSIASGRIDMFEIVGNRKTNTTIVSAMAVGLCGRSVGSMFRSIADFQQDLRTFPAHCVPLSL